MSFNHIMIDLETMGSRPGSVIASIGAIMFDPVEGKLGESFYLNVDMGSAASAGLTFDGDTISWWLQQSQEAREALRSDPRPLADVLDALTLFFREEGAYFFWSHGANFDEPVLSAAYEALRKKRPWTYSASRCTRTIFDLANVKPDRASGVHHNALDDARAQAQAVCEAYVRLGLATGACVDHLTVHGRGWMDVGLERVRQVKEEGWTPEHDDQHASGEMARAAAAYAVAYGAAETLGPLRNIAKVLWPWDWRWWKPQSRRRNLVRSGALIVAEIDHLDRAQARGLGEFNTAMEQLRVGRGAPRS